MHSGQGTRVLSPARPPRRPVRTAFRPGWRGTTALLHGPFRTLLAGQALGQLADGLTQIAFAQLVVFDIGRGATPGRIAGILAVTLLPFSVIGPVAGVFVDRWDRRRTLITTSQLRAALAAIAISAALLRSETLGYLGVVLMLSASRFVLDTKGAVLPRIVDASDLVRANAVSALVGMTAAFVGAVGGSLFVSHSVVAGFLAGAVGYLAAAGCFTRLPPVGGGQQRGAVGAALARLLRELYAGSATIVRTPDLRRPLTAVWLHRLLLGGGFVLLVLVGDRGYHLRASGYGLALAVTGIAAVIGTLLAPSLSARWPAAALVPLAFLPPAAAAAVVGYQPTLVGLICAVAITAVAFQCLKILTDALVGATSPDAVRGRVFAVYDVLYNVAFVLAGLLMIPLWHLGRERPLLWWLAAAFAAGWLVTARMVSTTPFPRHRERAAVASARWRMRGVALLCGAAVVVVFPRPSLWWAAWFVLTPWLIVIRRAPNAREAAVRGWWAAVGFLLAVHYWLLPSTTIFLPVITTLLGALWLPWSALSWRLLSGELKARRLAAATVVIPAGWVLIEAVRSWSALGGPWGLLGASQWRTPVFLAPASLGGVWLVSFLVVAVNVTVVVGIETSARRARRAAVATALGVIAIGPGWYAVQPVATSATTLPVAVVQAGVVHDRAQRLTDEITATDQLPADKFDLVVWGESSVGFDLLARPGLQHRLEAVAGRLRTDLLVNIDAGVPNGGIRKIAVLLDSQKILASYQKMRLVPFGEYIPMRPLLGWLNRFTKAASVNRVRGHHIVIMHAGGIPFAPLICFESAFPDMSRTAAREGAQLLVFQAATTTFQGMWTADQHASLAAVRAVESGRPALQGTLAGTTAAFDARGRRLAWHPDATGTVAVDLPLDATDTIYDRYGDWVLQVSISIIALAALVLSLLRSRTETGSRC